ncbi:ferrous iron transport protein A [Mesosutterella sp. OilRF-GAM-744-9]|uniref:Ferrous iron transport protein A n=1 Tax=Mesosutterella porci TaxID=2915351 RepID=A0ABS9MRC9_9BURK|nr:FeoA family protein [Mesosutterella sp. oilRF-744-WT-GAM-9]MCG5030937.1 ferrous iron transport protein A [Mesosutterella sp. oilRF-744-WT-GAM-9]
MKLNDLKVGEKGKILAFNSGAPDYRRHLLMMGATPGSNFEVVRVAPMGDPIEIRVRGSMVSVRKHEAAIVEVEKQ